jgi:acetyltransferase-like isoleucine patch superfamily enzyme
MAEIGKRNYSLKLPHILTSFLDNRISSLSSGLYTRTLRKKGVQVGSGTTFFSGSRNIDITRPCLVEIGQNCVFTKGVHIFTHGFDWSVLREKYGEILCSSGKVVIGNNVFLGVNVIVLKGVKIGSNTIIGAGSVVTHDIPNDCVAAGNPCEVLMSLEEYFQKRKKTYLSEAKIYAFEIYRKTGKPPKQEDFWEEFPIFLPRHSGWGKIPVRKQVGSAFEKFLSSEPLYTSFEDFLVDSGIPKHKIKNLQG